VVKRCGLPNFSGIVTRLGDVNSRNIEHLQENNMDMDVVRIIVAIFLPPLGVFLQVGFGKDFWINLLLTIFGFYILGIVHAVWIIAKK
jgi:uncharacterized membrane protein YqaE (UPF0057 family)